MGPIFVVGEDGRRAGVHFGFNAWGEKFAPWDRDAAVGSLLVEHLGDPCYRAPFVLEGGSIAVDDHGNADHHRAVPAQPQPQPRHGRAAIEEGLRQQLGVRTIVWFGDGLIEDRDTDGHVDVIADFAEDGALLLQSVPEDNPNHEACARNHEIARAAGLDVVDFPLLAYVEVAGERAVMGYLNLYACNGGVIVPLAGDPQDEEALERIAACYPSSEVVGVPASVIAYGGGGPHCITQQVPAHEADRGHLAAALARARARVQAPAAARRRRAAPLASRSRGASRRTRRGVRMAAGAGAQLVCLQELTLSPYFAVTAAVRAPPAPSRGAAGRPDVRVRRRAGRRDRRADSRLALRAGRGRRRPGLQTRRSSSGPAAICSRARASSTSRDRRYYEDHYFRPGPPEDGAPVVALAGAHFGIPDLLGPVVPRARARVLAGRRRGARLPDRDRLGARPPRLRHRAAVGARDRRERHHQRHVHDRRQRIGTEEPLTFYGSSFISDPYGRSSCRRRATSRRCWWPTSTSTSAGTGSSSSPS